MYIYILTTYPAPPSATQCRSATVWCSLCYIFYVRTYTCISSIGIIKKETINTTNLNHTGNNNNETTVVFACIERTENWRLEKSYVPIQKQCSALFKFTLTKATYLGKRSKLCLLRFRR